MRTLNRINDVWVFDNPDTGMREVFRNGHLITYFNQDCISRMNNGGYAYCVDYIQQMYVEDICYLGVWNEGAEWGDRIHKPFDPLATELWEGQ